MPVRRSLRHRHGIDMTPMVDLGFLLVTFFMIITQFLPPDPVQVIIPRSTSNAKIPDSNLITLLVSKEGRVYFKMDQKRNLQSLAEKLNTRWNLGLTPNEIENFSDQASFGVPASGLKDLLRLSKTERDKMTMPGIPVEPGHNELNDWLVYARLSNPRGRIVIKGDRLAPYPVIKKIMDTLQDRGINNFSLITDTEKK